MKVVVAEDEPVVRRIVEIALTRAGYEVATAQDGAEALALLQAEDGPRLAVLDWSMPEMDGVQVIRTIRALPSVSPPYIVVLTAREGVESVLAALESGANDYVTKSHDLRELVSRVNVGARVVRLQEELALRAREAEQALAHIKRLQGLLPICSYCKKIRTDQNYWQEIECYVRDHSDANFSHGVCPECYETVLAPQLAKFERDRTP